MLQVLSYQIADSIDIRSFKASYKGNLCHEDSDELFYKLREDSFIYVFRYGVACFLNVDTAAIERFLTTIGSFCKNLFKEKLSEEFQVEPHATQNNFGYNTISIVRADVDAYRLIMLNVSQSVALDYYSDLTAGLLRETNEQTRELETRGSLRISGAQLKKFIGKTLNLKNRISENLYIFDSPPETWEDEELNRIDLGLKKTFDLQERFRSIQESLQIVRENLELFKDIMQYRYSNLLEWIIIILIAVEVINLILEKLIR
ncbi:MAG TPA: RMD1 family protein [Puia sp.]|nr:RMD1 family protein [Puia sp.]